MSLAVRRKGSEARPVRTTFAPLGRPAFREAALGRTPPTLAARRSLRRGRRRGSGDAFTLAIVHAEANGAERRVVQDVMRGWGRRGTKSPDLVGGRTLVDHPTGGHDDYANALALATARARLGPVAAGGGPVIPDGPRVIGTPRIAGQAAQAVTGRRAGQAAYLGGLLRGHR